MPYERRRDDNRRDSMMGGPRRRIRRVDWFAINKVEPDWKDYKILSRYVTERGKILPRRLTGVSAKHQRQLAVAVKRARHLALLAFVAENIK